MERLVLCMLLVISSLQVLLIGAAGARPAPAMYVLGDSTLDVGNNNYLPGKDVPRANKPYYGIDFPAGRIPTGRFSNGYNTADYIAKNIGLASSPPPYLSLASSSGLLLGKALTTGVSYASAGAGILDSTNAGNNIPLSKQVQYLNATRAKMVRAVGSRVVTSHFSRSVFLMGIGNNDLAVFSTTEQARNRSAADQQADAAALFATLISNYSDTIRELYAMGARKLAIINVGLLGCIPAVRVFVFHPAGACAEGLNQLAAGFNAELQSLLAGLAPKLPGLVYSLADSYGLTRDTIKNPQASGYTDIACACCGSGWLGAATGCLPNSTVCANRDSYLFWDRGHASQQAAMLGAKAYFDGPAQYTTPINFKQLAQST